MNSHLKKPQLETRPSHGGITHGTPEYQEVITRVRQNIGAEPTMRQINDRKYQSLKKPPLFERTCPECQREFETTHVGKIACSPECARKRNNRTSKAIHNAAYVPRPLVPRTFICDQCGEEVTSMSPNPRTRFCDRKCLRKWHYTKRQHQVHADE